MSEPKLVSPLLDNFVIGNAISEHSGVSTYPAMRNDSDEKYIIKIISIPASDTQLQAMLLSGAYSTREAAIEYFAGLAKDTEQEAATLKMLSGLEGFLPYEGIQTVEKEDGSGFDIYILTTYKRSLQRHFRKYPMTHLAAVNLGLDMCASLAVCRQRGFIYANLKPSNIFISDDQEYRIGDIGFLPLSGLKYATLPDRYRSEYMAPELADPFAQIDSTIDTYAAGLILYQAYNGGVLPFENELPTDPLPAPLYADYEMAEIILKAISRNPADRWEDPIKMGQALVSYMQRNGANDTPIIPPAKPEETSAPGTEENFETESEQANENIYEQSNEAGQMMIETMIDYDAIMAIQAELENSPAEAEDSTAPDADADTPEEVTTEGLTIDEIPLEDTSSPLDEAAEEAIEAPAISAEMDAESSEFTEESEEQDICPDISSNTANAEYEFLDILSDDETTPNEETADPVTYEELPDDLSSILAQADDLIAHEPPAPVVAPEPIEIQIPAPITDAESGEDNESASQETDADPLDETIAAIDEAMATSTEGRLDKDLTNELEVPEQLEQNLQSQEQGLAPNDEEDKPRKSILNHILTAVLLLIIAACITVVGFLFYRDYYNKTIDAFEITGDKDTMTVYVKTDAEESLIRVICTDLYGNRQTARLESGYAVFTELIPKTQYKVALEIDGFHGLSGKTTGKYTTEACTEITNLNAVVGSDNTSAIITFTVTGEVFDKWNVQIISSNEEKRTEVFTGNTATITGLTTGNTYEFIVEPAEGGYVTGQNKITHKAIDLIIPENLAVHNGENGGLLVTWDIPKDATVNSWKVNCTSTIEGIYAQSLTVTEPEATFTEIDLSASSYNIEVVAEGMSFPGRFFLSENAVSAKDVQTSFTNGDLYLSWKTDASAPTSGWVVTYTVNDESTSHISNAEGIGAVIDNVIPGAEYHVSIQLTDGTTVIGGNFSLSAPEADKFAGYGVTSDSITFRMCLVPNQADWNVYYVKSFKDTFLPDEKAGFTMRLNQRYQVSTDLIDVLYVIKDAEGNLVSYNTTSQTWTSMWFQFNGELEIPVLPSSAGEYTIEIYFNGGFVHEQTFTIA